MATKLFSPSLTRRAEPPNSMATVMHVGTKTALVNFRGKSYNATMVGESWKQGDTGYFVEAPKGKYWITREHGSWYSNKLENWVKHGLRANATLEYFLRKCPKHSPYKMNESGVLLKQPNPTNTGFGSKGSFDKLDANGDGKISEAEFLAAGGSSGMFDKLDTDNDGYISREEWNRGRQGGGKIRIYGGMLGQVSGGGENPEEPEEPEDPTLPGSSGGVVIELPQSEIPECPSSYLSYLGLGYCVIKTQSPFAIPGNGSASALAIIGAVPDGYTANSEYSGTISKINSVWGYGFLNGPYPSGGTAAFMPISKNVVIRPYTTGGGTIWHRTNPLESGHSLYQYKTYLYYGSRKWGWGSVLSPFIPTTVIATAPYAGFFWEKYIYLNCARLEAVLP